MVGSTQTSNNIPNKVISEWPFCDYDVSFIYMLFILLCIRVMMTIKLWKRWFHYQQKNSSDGIPIGCWWNKVDPSIEFFKFRLAVIVSLKWNLDVCTFIIIFSEYLFWKIDVDIKKSGANVSTIYFQVVI